MVDSESDLLKKYKRMKPIGYWFSSIFNMRNIRLKTRPTRIIFHRQSYKLL